MKILVVEDTPINQIMIRVLLEKEGHEALIASTGAEALKRIGSEEFGLALMDIDLPDMSGIEVAMAIRSTLTRMSSAKYRLKSAYSCRLSTSSWENRPRASRTGA